MMDSEYPEFATEVRRLATTLRLKASPSDLSTLIDAYFRALRRHPLSAVIAGADVCIQRAKYFPKPAEWMEAIPQRLPVDVPTMTDAEASEYRQAEALRYEGDVCDCPVCQAAGITAAQPLRFVPEFTAEDTDRKVRDPIGDRIVTAGHWAHGEELKRWYVAKAHFYAKFYDLCAKKSIKKEKFSGTFEQRIDQIFKPKRREPPPESAT